MCCILATFNFELSPFVSSSIIHKHPWHIKPTDLIKRPEVETGIEETVRSVRLTRRAKYTPERPLPWRRKEETTEKEWRELGRRGGGEREGQFSKERDVSDDERASRAVEEIERSEEQFVKEMEVTWRNGELVSQVTMEEENLEEGRWSQGFFTVEMWKDSRALSCFGSNGEVEEDGVLRGGGMGAVVGEGVGEREGAAEMVTERWRRRRSKGNDNDGGFMVKT